MQQHPRLHSSTPAGSSSGGKTKISSNRDCTSFAKSIQGLTAAMISDADAYAIGGDEEAGGAVVKISKDHCKAGKEEENETE
jgi:hypothetical protein